MPKKVFSSVIEETHKYHRGHSCTRRPLSTGIFSAKNVTYQHGFEPTTSGLPGRRTANCAMVTRISKLVFTKWSNEVENWHNLENKTGTSKVGAISKAQKAQNIFLEKNLKFSKKFFFRKMSHSAEKCKRGDPFRFPNMHSVAK